MLTSSANFDPKLQLVLNVITSISFTLSTGLLPIVLYLIINKSRQMKKYRYYMLNNAVWCYLFHFCNFIARPTVLFPSFCMYVEPLLPIPLSDDVLAALFYLQEVIVINMDLSVVLSLFYRYSQAFPGWLNIYFEQSRSIYLIYAFVHISIYASVLLPMYFGRITDPEEVKKQFLTDNPHLADKIDNPMMCFSNTEKTKYMGLYVSVLLLGFFTMGTTLYTFLFVRMRIARKSSTIASTYRLQLMLFRAITAQLYIGYCFLLIPTVVVGFMIFWRVEFGGKATSILFTLMSIHDLLDYLTMLYFITPYRRTVLLWLRLIDKESMPTARVTFFTTSTVIRS